MPSRAPLGQTLLKDDGPPTKPQTSFASPFSFLALALTACAKDALFRARSGDLNLFGPMGSPPAANGSAVFEDLNTLTPEDLAATLVGPGVTVSNVRYTGAPEAAGTFAFTGQHDVIGLSSGIILSSGRIVDVEGPNTSPAITTDFGTPGDPDLDALAGFPTFDAAVLEFDFTVEPGADRIFIQYVFGSEEYNEYVGSTFNDVFAFFVNGENCALVDGTSVPVAINTVNHGRAEGQSAPAVMPSFPEFYVNNDPFDPDWWWNTVPYEYLLHTEMDGFTTVLVCEAEVDPAGTHTMKLAIADASDEILDSWVFLGQGSFTTEPPTPTPSEECVDLLAGQHHLAGEVCVSREAGDLTVTYRTDGGWTLLESHLAISSDPPGGGEWTHRANRWQNGPGSPAPGRFPFGAVHQPGVTTFTYTVALADISGGVGSGDVLYLAAHAALSAPDGGTESAWGAGERFRPQGNWATYFTFTLP